MDNAQQWSIRIMHERQQHDLCCFLTLTYNDHYLPNPPTLVKRHFQTFMKRLRKYIWSQHKHLPKELHPKIKYYMCGEYGGKTHRPHYHAILFGVNFSDKKFRKFSGGGDRLFTSEKLDELWGLGHCWIGNVTYQSAGYVARYCMKKVNGNLADEHYSYVNKETGEIAILLKEYMAASNRLGLDHFLEHKTEMYRRDSVIVNGKEAPIPKYYDRKLGELNPDLLEEIKYQRQERARKRAADNTPARLAVKEEIKKAQVSQLRRDLE